MGQEEDIVNTLKYLGFTEYEARVYIGLNGLGFATAREVSEVSGVPQGRIYSVLKSLAEKGYIYVQHGTPAYFGAENPGDVIRSLKGRVDRLSDKAAEYLSNLHYDTTPPLRIWSIQSETGIKNRLKTLIQNAESEILIFGNGARMLAPVWEDLKKVRKKVKISVYTDQIAEFADLRVDVSGFSERTLRFVKEIRIYLQKHKNFVSGESVLILVDYNANMVIESGNGKLVGNVIMMPEFCFMIKSLLILLQKGNLKMSNGETLF